jgi:16S rRNA (guanine(966)-N(2))-methyltransferase RsmD
MAGIRIIGGIAKGRRLRLVQGEGTRPVSDRVKESLFNIIGADIEQAWMLDLFAGTGSVGIEALSRGAAGVTLVDHDVRAIATLRANLKSTGLEGKGNVVRADAFALLAAPPLRRFDYVYIAPPQYNELWSRAVTMLDAHPNWLHPDAWVVAQIHPKEHRELALAHLKPVDQRKYGSTLLVFYELPGE